MALTRRPANVEDSLGPVRLTVRDVHQLFDNLSYDAQHPPKISVGDLEADSPDDLLALDDASVPELTVDVLLGVRVTISGDFAFVTCINPSAEDLRAAALVRQLLRTRRVRAVRNVRASALACAALIGAGPWIAVLIVLNAWPGEPPVLPFLAAYAVAGVTGMLGVREFVRRRKPHPIVIHGDKVRPNFVKRYGVEISLVLGVLGILVAFWPG